MRATGEQLRKRFFCRDWWSDWFDLKRARRLSKFCKHAHVRRKAVLRRYMIAHPNLEHHPPTTTILNGISRSQSAPETCRQRPKMSSWPSWACWLPCARAQRRLYKSRAIFYFFSYFTAAFRLNTADILFLDKRERRNGEQSEVDFCGCVARAMAASSCKRNDHNETQQHLLLVFFRRL